MAQRDLSPGQISEIVGLAWADEVSFDDIEKIYGLPEKDVILLMRAEMKASSFRMWRKRVSGRKTKHLKKSRDHEEPRESDLGNI